MVVNIVARKRVSKTSARRNVRTARRSKPRTEERRDDASSEMESGLQ